jgi:hypothetical protein
MERCLRQDSNLRRRTSFPPYIFLKKINRRSSLHSRTITQCNIWWWATTLKMTKVAILTRKEVLLAVRSSQWRIKVRPMMPVTSTVWRRPHSKTWRYFLQFKETWIWREGLTPCLRAKLAMGKEDTIAHRAIRSTYRQTKTLSWRQIPRL